MEAYLGAPDPLDAIEIDGSPRLSVRIPGGIHGDTAKAALVINSIPKVLEASPGLHTMLDMPLPSFFGAS
jgi:4-hydroxy-tetrahydrodipicolinate reductase